MPGPNVSRRRIHVRRRPIISAGLLVALVWLLAPGAASAHAHLIQANPAPDSVVAQTPTTATFVFDEPLNPALTRVRIVDTTGRQVAGDHGYLASGHNNEVWQLPLSALPAGTYSVFWTSESATDGHIISSFYTFRVASSGGSASLGAVGGAAAGVYGGTSAGSDASLSAGFLAITFFTWLDLMAQALWLGALVVELAVLSPGRRAAGTPAARLAWAAAPRVWWLVRGAPVIAVWALVGQVLSLAGLGTNGDWSRALAPATLAGILSSQNGHLVLLRCAVLLVALLASGRMRPAALESGATPAVRSATAAAGARTPRTLGIVATSTTLPRGYAVRGTVTVLAVFYMLLAALSGHAADVTPGWLSYPTDWLHLLCTAAWAGGIGALAYGVVPARHALLPDERAPALLPLLNRFSPVALAAVGVLALSGLYNAVNHLSSPSMLSGTTYGQLLLVKLLLVAALAGLSATHLWGLRPRIARMQRRAAHDRTALAAVHDGLGTLAGRLRLEAGVAAAILLVTALMGQTLPPRATATLAAPGAAIPESIVGASAAGDLRAQLTVTPPAVGSATFSVQVWEKGIPVTGDTGAVILHVFARAQPTVRANLTTQASGTVFRASGSIAGIGIWRVDVLVRTSTVNEYRTLPFTFTVGPGATFLAAGVNPDAVTIAVIPGLISAPNTFTVAGLHEHTVRILSQSLDMDMGILPLAATPLGHDRWRVGAAYAPMNGRWGLTVQVQRAGAWTTVRQFVYQVPLRGPMTLMTPTGGAATSGTATQPGRIANKSLGFNTSLARTLPYTALVTEMGSNGVRRVGGTLVPTGLQAHGVDVLDGTPFAYVTNFGAEPGTVSQIDLRTMRVIRTIPVGLGPAHIIFAPDHRRAFVTDFRSSDLYVIDLASGRTQSITFPAGDCFEPHGIDISEDGRTLYVACAGGAWIYTVDTQSLRPGRTVVTGPGAFGVAVDGPRHEVWVTNQSVNTVTVLDERTLKSLATIPVGQGPALLVPTPDGRTVYVADQFGNTVTVIDAATRHIIATIPVAAQPHGPDVTPDGKYVYVASIAGNAVTIIRTSDNKVVAIVPSPDGSNEVAIARP